MKKRIVTILSQIHFWSLFLGLVVGFGGGFILLNALVPNATELIRLYGMDRLSHEQKELIQQGVDTNLETLKVNRK